MLILCVQHRFLQIMMQIWNCHGQILVRCASFVITVFSISCDFHTGRFICWWKRLFVVDDRKESKSLLPATTFERHYLENKSNHLVTDHITEYELEYRSDLRREHITSVHVTGTKIISITAEQANESSCKCTDQSSIDTANQCQQQSDSFHSSNVYLLSLIGFRYSMSLVFVVTDGTTLTYWSISVEHESFHIDLIDHSRWRRTRNPRENNSQHFHRNHHSPRSKSCHATDDLVQCHLC